MSLRHITSGISFQQTTIAALLACLLLQVTAGFTLRESNTALDSLAKRDVKRTNPETQCRGYPRNCPENALVRRSQVGPEFGTKLQKATEGDRLRHALLDSELSPDVTSALMNKLRASVAYWQRARQASRRRGVESALSGWASSDSGLGLEDDVVEGAW